MGKRVIEVWNKKFSLSSLHFSSKSHSKLTHLFQHSFHFIHFFVSIDWTKCSLTFQWCNKLIIMFNCQTLVMMCQNNNLLLSIWACQMVDMNLQHKNIDDIWLDVVQWRPRRDVKKNNTLKTSFVLSQC